MTEPVTPTPLPADVVTLLNRIYAAVHYMGFNLENQDQGLVIEMTLAMLGSVIETGQLGPMIDYVKRYCDVIDGPEDAEEIAADI